MSNSLWRRSGRWIYAHRLLTLASLHVIEEMSSQMSPTHGQNVPPSMRNTGSREAPTSSLHSLQTQVFFGFLLMDSSFNGSLQLLPDIFTETSLGFDLETRGNGGGTCNPSCHWGWARRSLSRTYIQFRCLRKDLLPQRPPQLPEFQGQPRNLMPLLWKMCPVSELYSLDCQPALELQVSKLCHKLRQGSLVFSLKNELKRWEKSEKKCWKKRDTKAMKI